MSESRRLFTWTRFFRRMANRSQIFRPELHGRSLLLPAPSSSVFHVNAKDAAWVDSKTTPHPTRCFTQKLKVTGAYQSISKKIYIRAPLFTQKAFDQALERCSADHTWQTATVKCGHDVMIDEPEELSTMLERFA